MDDSAGSSNIVDGDRHAASTGCSSTSVAGRGFKLFNRHCSIHQFMGGGRTADVLLWKRHRLSLGVIVVATVAWLIVEWSGLPLLSVCSDVLLLLIMLIFIHAKYAAYRNTRLDTLLKLELSEEMVNNAAASFHDKINYLLLMAHNITVGKDFVLSFQVVISLWIMSAVASCFSFFTLAYIGTLLSITVPALCSRYEERMDTYCGVIRKKVSQHYKVIVTKLQIKN